MQTLSRWLLSVALITGPAASQAIEPTACTALQAEVETLRAKLRALETAAAPAAVPAAIAPAVEGLAPKPAPVQRVVVEQPYSRTGCSESLFKGMAPARWQDGDLWLDLEKGLSPAAVEKLLGVEHYDEQGGGNLVWHYGKCGAASRAQLLFTDGKLANWRAPSR